MKTHISSIALSFMCFHQAVAASLQDAIDAADDGGTVVISSDETVYAAIAVGKSIKISGNGHAVRAGEGYSGTVFEIAGDDIYVQLCDMAIEGHTAISVNAGAHEQGHASLRMFGCSVVSRGNGLVYANGGCDKCAAYSDSAFTALPKQKALAVQNCSFARTADGEYESAGIIIRSFSPGGVNQVLVGLTSISGHFAGIEIADDVADGDMLVVGPTVMGGSTISAVRPILCNAHNFGMHFYNSALDAMGDEDSAGIWFGDAAYGNSLAFKGRHGEVGASEGAFAYICAKGAEAVDAIDFGGKVSFSGASGAAFVLDLRAPARRREYSALTSRISGAENVDSASRLVREVLPYGIGDTGYATFEDAKTALEADRSNLALAIRFENGRPVVELCRTNELDGLKVSVRYAASLARHITNEWNEAVLSKGVPPCLFFTAVVEEVP